MAAGLCTGLLLGTACRPARPPGQPADAVQRFYAAAVRSDCAGALQALGGTLRGKVANTGRCEELFEQTLEHPLEHVLGTQVDGRDPAAHLVRARLRGRVTDVIIRVQAEDGQWKIFAL